MPPLCLHRLDQKIRRQAGGTKKLLLLVDNAASHAVEGAEETTMEGLKALELPNLTVLFLPANTTAIIQPLDQGIIAAFKVR